MNNVMNGLPSVIDPSIVLWTLSRCSILFGTCFGDFICFCLQVTLTITFHYHHACRICKYLLLFFRRHKTLGYGDISLTPKHEVIIRSHWVRPGNENISGKFGPDNRGSWDYFQPSIDLDYRVRVSRVSGFWFRGIRMFFLGKISPFADLRWDQAYV